MITHTQMLNSLTFTARQKNKKSQFSCNVTNIYYFCDKYADTK